MTGREVLRLEQAAELLACGRADKCRQELEALIRENGGNPPASPSTTPTGPGTEARAAA